MPYILGALRSTPGCATLTESDFKKFTGEALRHQPRTACRGKFLVNQEDEESPETREALAPVAVVSAAVATVAAIPVAHL